jgi:hypothetical protein
MINRPSLRTLKDKTNLVGIEIGVDRGLNTENVLQNLDIRRLYLIDPYDLYDYELQSREQSKNIEIEARDRLCEYPNIVWIKESSKKAITQIKEKVDFVYIDGDHRMAPVKSDLDLYYNVVKDNGLLCGHDFDFPDVRAAIVIFLNKNKSLLSAGLCEDSLVVLDWWITKSNKWSPNFGGIKILTEDGYAKYKDINPKQNPQNG